MQAEREVQKGTALLPWTAHGATVFNFAVVVGLRSASRARRPLSEKHKPQQDSRSSMRAGLQRPETACQRCCAFPHEKFETELGQQTTSHTTVGGHLLQVETVLSVFVRRLT